jgi:hypothetical protein
MDTTTTSSIIKNDSSYYFNLINKYYFLVFNRIHKQSNNTILPLFNYNNIIKLYVNLTYSIPDIYMKNLILLSAQLNILWNNVDTLYNDIYLNLNNEQNDDLLIELIFCFNQMKHYNKQSILLIYKVIEICKHIKEENTTIEYDPLKFMDSLHINLNNNKINIINYPPNFEWFTILIEKYNNYNGTFPTTTFAFINFFKNNWDKISDSDTLILTPIFLEILGGISVEYNAYCLEDWIKKNIDIIQEKSNWIFTNCNK